VAGSALARFSDELASLVEHVSLSTVSLNGRPHRPGTATVVAPDLVVTADHTVERDDDLSVQTSDGRTLSATLVGRDPASDLALLRVADLNGVAPSTATTAPRVGSLALAVTRSWQGRPTARLGIVSGVSGMIRYGRGSRLDSVILTDIGLSRGLSGSPLVNAQGELLGIVTTGLLRGVPIAIPHDTVTQVIATLREHGRMRRGYLGVALQTVRLNERQRAGRDQSRGALIVGPLQRRPGGYGRPAGRRHHRQRRRHTCQRNRRRAGRVAERGGRHTPLRVEVLRGASLTTVDVLVGEPPQ